MSEKSAVCYKGRESLKVKAGFEVQQTLVSGLTAEISNKESALFRHRVFLEFRVIWTLYLNLNLDIDRRTRVQFSATVFPHSTACIARKGYLLGVDPAWSRRQLVPPPPNVLQSDPDLVPPDLVTPRRFSDRINFPRYRKLTVFDPDLVPSPI
eukprot:sb/3473324/